MLSIFSIFLGCSNTNSTKNAHRYNGKEEYFLLRGENFSQEKKYVEAIKEFEQAKKMNSKNVITLLEMGYCYGELGDEQTAVEYYKNALLIDPKNKIALKNLAFISYKNKNFDIAEQYLANFPKNFEDSFVLRLKGYIAVEKKQYKNAYQTLAKAHAVIKEYDEELYQKSAEVLRALNEENALYTFLENRYVLHRNNPRFVAFYGSTLDKTENELLSSEKVLKRYMAENPKDDMLLIILAKNNIKQNKLREAGNILTLVSNKSLYTTQYIEVKNQLTAKKKS